MRPDCSDGLDDSERHRHNGGLLLLFCLVPGVAFAIGFALITCAVLDYSLDVGQFFLIPMGIVGVFFGASMGQIIISNSLLWGFVAAFIMYRRWMGRAVINR